MRRMVTVLTLVLAVGTTCLAAEIESTAASSQTSAAECACDVVHGKINTDDAATVNPGAWELSFRGAYGEADRHWDNGRDLVSRGSEDFTLAGLGFTMGIIPNVDANVALGYAWLNDEEFDFDVEDGVKGPTSGSNLGDTAVGFRWRFFRDEKTAFMVAYLGGFTIPTGSDSTINQIGTSQEFWSWDQSVVANKDWGRFTTNAQVGYSLPFGEHRDDALGTLIGNLAAGYQVCNWLQPEAELNYKESFIDDGQSGDLLATTVGLIFPIGEHFMLKAGVQQGLTGRNADDATTGIVTAKVCF